MPARHRLGNLDLAILTDGTYYQDAGAVFGIVPRVMWERLGVREPGGASGGLHTPTYRAVDAAVPAGMKAMARVIVDYLEAGAAR